MTVGNYTALEMAAHAELLAKADWNSPQSPVWEEVDNSGAPVICLSASALYDVFRIGDLHINFLAQHLSDAEQMPVKIYRLRPQIIYTHLPRAVAQ